ncbi:hypothetical protein [Romboutsia weinsteinii]|uniref:hypothetical protein n=1 Tax=Romboutsia weinsteinii TaxID=2020949 RepID=UPI0013141809|nr:hypothetical protein [Romboutsia weinsteinii]
MELMTKFIIGTLGTIVIGLVTNYIFDKIKNHSSSANRKSGTTIELDIKFKFNKK